MNKLASWCFFSLPNDHVFIEEQFTVLIVVAHLLVEDVLHELAHPLSVHLALPLGEVVQDVQSHLKVPSEVVAHGQARPGGSQTRFKLTYCLS